MTPAIACAVCSSPAPTAVTYEPWCCSTPCTRAYIDGVTRPSALVMMRDTQRKAITIYQCDTCGARVLGEQRCEDCTTFMRKVGVGGRCTCCDDLITVRELVGEEVILQS